jgi:predicted DNA-binding protein (UPF0251 family)
VVYFKPQGVPLRELEEQVLGLDEVEALRLADLGGLSQEEAGLRMGVSRATIGRILERARAKVADALTAGKALRIEGGPAVVARPHGGRRRRGMPRGDGTGPEGKGPGTGRRAGFCSGNDEAGHESRPGGGRHGRGHGQGHGFGDGGGRRRGRRCGGGRGRGRRAGGEREE